MGTWEEPTNSEGLLYITIDCTSMCVVQMILVPTTPICPINGMVTVLCNNNWRGKWTKYTLWSQVRHVNIARS